VVQLQRAKMHKPKNRSTLTLASLCALGLACFSVAALAVSDLSDNGDFAPIATAGFTRTVDGAYFADAQRTQFPNLQPNSDGKRPNFYSWSMAWFKNALWVGTNNFGTGGNQGGGQIWRYRPSSLDEAGDWGLSGTWDLMYDSPFAGPLVALVTQLTDIKRDFGYRSMAVCDAGDKIPRLYVGSFGLPGRILYYAPLRKTFKETSRKGLFTGAPSLLNLSLDLAHRALACYRGRLWTSPAGYFGDVDTTPHPVLMMNPDPAGGAPWQRLVDVSDPASHPLADPDNIGIFQAEVVGAYLYLSVVNRTSGLELWRGDGKDCPPPWESDGPCHMVWTKIIDNGAGRPPDVPGNPIDNGGATLGVIGDDLYVGAGDSGVEGFVHAELIRVPNAGTPPSADPAVPHTWELLVGWPRRDFGKPAERLPGLENLECHNVGDMADTAPPFWTEPLTQLDGDDLVDDCLPTSNMGPGFNLDLPDPQWSGLKLGAIAYLWRFAYHQGDVLVGTTDHFGDMVPGEPEGFSLLKSSDGVHWSAVSRDGLGDPDNWGLRSMQSVPDLGLVVGTTNFSGNQVYIGTTLPPSDRVPPAPDGGGDQLIFDWGKTGKVDAQLDASKSADPFGGGGITHYEWFAGSLDQLGSTCSNLDANDAFSTQVAVEVTDLTSKAGDQTAIDHWYTLRVTDVDGLVNCKEVKITASYDLPPTVEVHTGVPYGPPDADGEATLPLVKTIDFDGDGVESYDVTGLCKDDFAELVRCELVPVDVPGNTLSAVSDTRTQPGLCSGLGECSVSATVSTPAPDSRAAALGATDGRPDLYLIAVDQAGHETRFRWESLTQVIADNPGNDAPVCRNADVYMIPGVDTQIQVNPAVGEPPVCVDPDGDAMAYTDGGADPALGTVAFDGTLTYTPDDFTIPGVDQLEFLATDPAPASSSTTTLRVNMIADTTGPEVTVDFPAQHASYLRRGLKAGCGTASEADLCGSASDARSQVTAVEVSVQRLADGTWWNGTNFVAGEPMWLPASGTNSWSLDGFLPRIGGDFRIQARARDTFDNLGVSEPVDFHISFSLLQQLFARLFGH